MKPQALAKFSICLTLFLSLLVNPAAAQRSAGKKPPSKKPAASTSRQLAMLDAIFEQAVRENQIPGAVVLVGHNGRTIYRKAFGYRSLEPRREAMTVDTIFDMASLTKSLVTANSVMRMVELGQIRLNDAVAKYIPEFGGNGKQEITIRQLMVHHSGLREDLDLKTPWQGYDEALRLAWEEKPIYPPGSRFLYSDINYIVLGELVRRISGMPPDKYADAHFFQPLHMTNTRFLPPIAWLPRIAPTEYDEGGVMLRGVVHDPTARRMGGVAGHAGLFSTADDVSKMAQALIAALVSPSRRASFLRSAAILNPLTIEKMTTPQQPPNSTGVRGLGWDIDSPLASNRGELLPVGSFGHTGFTGTSLWMDPVTNTYIIVLSNAVHPRGGTNWMVSIRSRVATAVAAALELKVSEKEKLRLARITGYNEAANAPRRIPFRNGAVQNGIDVLQAHDFDVLRSSGKRKIGLVTNQTGLDLQGRRTIDVLAKAPGIELAAIFSPEHGVTGTLDTSDISNSRDAATGIAVYSVYGNTDAKRRPPEEVLKTLDAVVYDIQDAGVRFYTYETTMGYFLEATARAGIEMIVLDRPDPITGAAVQGPILEAGRENFVGYSTVPVRHGMTMGELAKMYNGERKINARLAVVPAQGWMRGDWFDSTGLAWTNPSPNLRSLTEATLYPGVALVEGTNVSVGRGTDTPFEVLGAPWVKPREFAEYLNARNISGVRFVPITFTPASGKYQEQACGGVNMVLLDRNALDSPELGIELASALRKLYPNQFQMEKMIDLLANKPTFDAIGAGVDPRRIAEDWREGLEQFQELRKKYLLY